MQRNQLDGASNLPIHIIWCGGPLVNQHIARLERWKALHPHNEVNLWVDSGNEERIKQQLAGKGINIKNIASLQISNQVRHLIQVLSTSCTYSIFPGAVVSLIANYAAVSDLIRFYILATESGWYCDTDIEPFDVNALALHPDLKFFITAVRNDDNTLANLTPGVIAATKDSPLLKNAIRIIEEMNDVFLKYASLICSNLASVRTNVTYLTTGTILRMALGKILVDDVRLLNYLNTLDGKDNTIPGPNVELFDEVSRSFKHYREFSWVCDFNTQVEASGSSTTLSKKQDIILDQAFLDSFRPQQTTAMSSSSYGNLNAERNATYAIIPSINIQTKKDSGLKLHSGRVPFWSAQAFKESKMAVSEEVRANAVNHRP